MSFVARCEWLPSVKMPCLGKREGVVDPPTIATGIPGIASSKLLERHNVVCAESPSCMRTCNEENPPCTKTSLIFHGNHHSNPEIRPKIFHCTRASSSEATTPQTRKLETCVRSRKPLVREIGELVKTRFEREILSVGSAKDQKDKVGCLY